MAEAAAAAYDLHYVDTLQAAVLWLATHPPAAVLVDLDLPAAEELCRKVRTKRRVVDVAIFGLAREITDAAFVRALRWGVDDVTSPGTEGALSHRLIALPADQTIPPTARGDAVVAIRDDSELLVGRLLTNAGYEVEYARDATALRQLAGLERMRLVVASEAAGGTAELVATLRQRGNSATWLVLAPAADVPRLERALAGVPKAGVVSRTDPLEYVLFVSNELAAPQTNAREERRVLHGTLVQFRVAPDGPVEHGYTYNVSPRGLYVRTLAPPVDDHLLVEVAVPNTQTMVRLEGVVAWRRGFARLGSATAPPGFGLRIVGGSEDDLRLWARGCTQLLVARHAPEKPAHTEEPLDELAEPPSPVAVGDAGLDAAGGTSSELTAAMAATPPQDPLGGGPGVEATAQSTPLEVPKSAQAPVIDEAESRRFENATAGSLASLLEPSLPPPERASGKPPAEPDEVAPAPAGSAVGRAAPLGGVHPAPARARKGATLTSLALGGLLGLLFAVGTIGVLLTLEHRRPAPAAPVALPPGPPSVGPQQPSSASAPGPNAPPPDATAAPAVDAGLPEADAGGADAADAGAADAGAADDAAVAADPPGALVPPTPRVTEVAAGELTSFEAFLVVESSASTRVFSNGVDVGPTNTKNRVRCGLRNVRLGDAAGQWRSAGDTVEITCSKLVQIRIEPSG